MYHHVKASLCGILLYRRHKCCGHIWTFTYFFHIASMAPRGKDIPQGKKKKSLAATRLHVTYHLTATIYEPYIIPCSQINNTCHQSLSSDSVYTDKRRLGLCFCVDGAIMSLLQCWRYGKYEYMKIDSRGCEVNWSLQGCIETIHECVELSERQLKYDSNWCCVKQSWCITWCSVCTRQHIQMGPVLLIFPLVFVVGSSIAPKHMSSSKRNYAFFLS